MPVIDDSHALPPTSALPSIADAVDRIAGANPGYPAIALVRNTQTFEGHYVETTSWGELAALSKRAAYFLTAPEHGINLKHGWVPRLVVVPLRSII